MKRTIEINYGTSITMNRGNYENEKPMWHQKTLIEFNGETPEQMEQIEKEERDRLKKVLNEEAELAWSLNKQALAGIRTRIKNGRKYPSVTSIINPDPLPEYVTSKEFGKVPMTKYQDKGNEYQRIFNHKLETGKFIKPSCDISPLKWDLDIEGWFELFGKRLGKYALNVEVFHDKHVYSGEIDYLGEVDDLQTVLDVKTGSWKLEQVAAYAKCRQEVKQIAIADLKEKDLIVFSLDNPESVEAWESFLKLRGAFLSRFGI